jgi:hypothetical protein
MRLGAFPDALDPAASRRNLRLDTEISERHRHRYEVNTNYRDKLEAGPDLFRHVARRACCPRSSNAATIPGSSACSIHPELKSRPFEPHPLFAELHRGGGRATRMRMVVTIPRMQDCSGSKFFHIVKIETPTPIAAEATSYFANCRRGDCATFCVFCM